MRRPNLSGFSTATSMSPPSLDAGNTDTINRGRLGGAFLVLVQNTKGGPGKTTCVLNLAVGYKLQGKRVLIVDADTRQKTAKKWPRPANVRYPIIVECDPSALLERLARWMPRCRDAAMPRCRDAAMPRCRDAAMWVNPREIADRA